MGRDNLVAAIGFADTRIKAGVVMPRLACLLDTTQRPCSGWCRPDEGVHVFLSGWMDQLPVSLQWVGHTGRMVDAGWSCLPVGTESRLVALDEVSGETVLPAGFDNPYNYVLLMTVQVVS